MKISKDYTDAALKELVQATVTETLVATGQASGEISQSQARRLYGRWFLEAVAAGRLHPVNSGKGNTSTKWYSIVDIRTLRASEYIRADIITKTL